MVSKAIKRDPKESVMLPDSIGAPGGLNSGTGGVKLSAKKSAT